MYALRLVYQRHRKLAPWVAAMVALFFVTLITTMPVPRAGAAQAKFVPAAAPVVGEAAKAGELASLLSQERLESGREATLAFVPPTGAF